MIQVSDNRATDTVLAALGRSKVDAMAERLGADARSLPVLSTREAFALKTVPALGDRWPAPADPAARLALLAENRAMIAEQNFAPESFSAKPMRIDSVEWFASPAAMARAMDWLRTDGGETVRAIMAINPGVDPALAARFGYIGYKGGSEPGVIAMHFLVRTKNGRWFAVTGHWNDAARPVSDLTFATLMSRALGLVPQD